MRLTLIAFGTRGDITPFVALGARLRAEGHDVRIATHAEFESFANKYGLEFHRVPGSFQDFVATKEGRHALGVPRSTPMGLAGLLRPFDPCAEEAYAAAWRASDGADGIVTSPVALPVGVLVSEYRGVPLAIGQAMPVVPTKFFPHPVFYAWPLGAFYNRATYFAADLLVRRTARDLFERWDAEASRLSEGRARQPLKVATLVAVSPTVAPRPTDWLPDAHMTGYWFLPPAAQAMVSDELKAFVESGPAPICLGFGSMMDDNPAELRAIVLETLDRLNLRAVIVGGSGSALFGFGDVPNVREVGFADYGWLFPRVRAVVHQGGAGTASYCMTAGVPQVVVRYCLDHNFWAWRLHAIGVAPPGLLRQTLTASSLAGRIRQALEDPRFACKASELAPLVRAEDGLANAMRVIDAHFKP